MKSAAFIGGPEGPVPVVTVSAHIASMSCSRVERRPLPPPARGETFRRHGERALSHGEPHFVHFREHSHVKLVAATEAGNENDASDGRQKTESPYAPHRPRHTVARRRMSRPRPRPYTCGGRRPLRAPWPGRSPPPGALPMPDSLRRSSMISASPLILPFLFRPSAVLLRNRNRR